VPGTGRPPCVLQHDGYGKPAAGRLSAFKDKAGISQDLEEVFKKFPRLLERKAAGSRNFVRRRAADVSHGPRADEPSAPLLLDEPSMGLAPLLVKEIFNIIKEINESGTTILLVEQNAKMALDIADKAYVLETGRITLAGTAKELQNSEAVQKAYLGG
jgi:branched-chain amino acid transport system ATP-binding protein